MSERVSSEERSVITRLVQAGFDRIEARIAVLLAARGFSRPLSDLGATLQHYAELEDASTTERGVLALIAKGVLTRERSALGNDLVAPAIDIAHRLAALANDAALQGPIEMLRRNSAATMKVIGPLRDAASYESYAERLRDAQSDIRMPIVMTDPKALETVSILQERAVAGVKIRILGATPKVVGRLRGATQVNLAKTRISAWRQIARANDNIEYRLSDHEEDMLFATSILIDGEVLRLILHDPFHERSKEGLVVEFGGGAAKGVNLVRDFAARFDIAWRHSRRPGIRGDVAGWAGASWQMIFALLLFAAAAATADIASGLGQTLGPQWQPIVFNLALALAPALLATWWQHMRRRGVERHALASGG